MLLHGLGEPGHDLQVVSCWTPNDDIVLTSGYSKDLGMCTWKCGGGKAGSKEGGKPQSAAKLVAAAHGLWTALQVSVMRMQYLGNARTWGSRSQRCHTVWGEPGQDLRVVRGQAMNNAFSDIVLTSGYAGGLGNVPMEVWGRRGKAARRGEALWCCKASWHCTWAVDCTTSISKAHMVSG